MNTVKTTEEEFSHEHVLQMCQNSNKGEGMQAVIQYLSKFIVKTLYGIFYRPQRQKNWIPINKTLLKFYCNSDLKLYSSFFEWGGNNNVSVVLSPNETDELDSKGFYTKINLWSGYKCTPSPFSIDVKEIVKPWISHLMNCWCDHDMVLTSQLLRHFSCIIRNPRKRSQMNIVLKTTNQNEVATECKNVIFEPFKKILGNHFASVDAKGTVIASSNDNQVWAMSLIIVLSGHFLRPKQIMDLVENDQILLKFGGFKAIMVENFMNIFISTNHYKEQFKFPNLLLNINDQQFVETHQQTHHFDKIRNTPPEALLSFLLNYDTNQ